jgi:exodeoxyribonuclease V beta subunit
LEFNILNRDLNVFAPYFLEASAGTGKTFAIEHFVARLLIEGDSPLTIDQILVVTFTRAAARELKKRIRDKLCRCKEHLLQGGGPDYLQAICEKGGQNEVLQKLEAALIQFDTAQIYTLHGFCHRALTEFAFEAGLGFEVPDPDEKQHRAALAEWIKRQLKRSLASSDYSPYQMKLLINKYGRDHRKMIAALMDLVGGSKQMDGAPTFNELYESFLSGVRSFPPIEKSKFKADVEALRAIYRKIDEKEMGPQLELLGDVLESKECTYREFEQLLKGKFFLEKMSPEHRKVRAKELAAAMHYPGIIDRLREVALPFIEKAKDPSAILLRLGRDLKEKARAHLESIEKFSPDELLSRMQRAAQLPHFAERVRKRYRAAIIDEFQDTDPIQWDIFQKLFLSLPSICLVGDPKQSIYAFRSADVYTYLEAAKAMGPDAKRHLATNYRSTAPLVEALNLLFSKADGHWMALPRSGKALEVKPVHAGSADSYQESEAPLQFFITVGKKGREKKFPTSQMLENKILPFLAAEIFSLHREKNVEYHDIAVLIKDRYMAKEVVDYLKSHGIPAASKQGSLITESIAYFALKEMLAAVCFPNDLSKVKTALGGPLIGWDQRQLEKGWDDPDLLQAKAQMHSLRNTLLEKGFGSFFQRLQGEMLGRVDQSLYLDLRKLAELCIEEAMARDVQGARFLDFLTELGIESHREDPRLKTAAQDEKGSVAVMTVHVSKGLEFDTVFALGTAARHKLSELIAVDQEMRPYEPEDPDCRRSIEEQDAEKMRQLYVALTRAKRRLYIALCIDEEQKPIQEGEASPMELFFARLRASDLNGAKAVLTSLSPRIEYRVLEEMPDVSYEKGEEGLEVKPPIPVELPRFDEQLFSFSSLAKKESHFEAAAPLDSLSIPSPHNMPLGSETGHLLHQLFEKIFKKRLHHPLNEKAISELISEEMALTPLESWHDVLLPWTIELLKKELAGFALADLPGAQIQQEMEFYFPVSRGMMKGFCDLLFEFDGKYYLLDWKSNYLGPADAHYTQEKMAEAMHAHDYFLQASIYAAALQRFVKLFDIRPFSECFGGAIYYFIRGKAFYHFIPEPYEHK